MGTVLAASLGSNHYSVFPARNVRKLSPSPEWFGLVPTKVACFHHFLDNLVPEILIDCEQQGSRSAICHKQILRHINVPGFGNESMSSGLKNKSTL